MYFKTLTTQMTNPHVAIKGNEQYYTCPMDMHIMKCLVSKGHYSSLSVGLYPVEGHTDCVLALYCNNDKAIQSHCSVTVKTINKNAITQLIPNHYLMSAIQSMSIEHRYPGDTNIKTFNPPLALITIPE